MNQNAKQEHNPDKLTPEQYGAPEWRLLYRGERELITDEYWHPTKCEWRKNPVLGLYAIDASHRYTMRRRITPASAPADAPKGVSDQIATLQVERYALAEQCANYRTALLELCEKMEAGLSGVEETKRARTILGTKQP